MGLNVENVSKHFGTKLVVDNLTFNMPKPGVFGLLGTNGAGKTTTIRMILGIIKKDSGNITWNNKPVERKNVNFGYLPEERGIYPKVKIRDQLMYFAKLKGMSNSDAENSLKYWMERLKVIEYIDLPAEKLSKGNQQKIQFITSVIHDPELVILDEPFSGLDPVNTDILKNVILELVEKEKYIIMSSHQMTSIEEFCTDVLILDKGNTVLNGNLDKIKNEYKANKIELFTSDNIQSCIDSLNIKIDKHKDFEYILSIENEQQGKQLFNSLAKNNINITKFELKKPNLHDIFVEKVGKGDN